MLFLNTAKLPPLGAGPWLHAQIMGGLDRSAHDVTAATAPGTPAEPAPMRELVRRLPDVRLVDVDLGPDHVGEALRGSIRSKGRLGLSLGRALVDSVSLAVRTRRLRIDVIHTDERPRDALLAVVIGRLIKAKSVVHMHVNYGEWMSPLLKWSIRRADAIIAISDFVRDSLVESGCDLSSIRVVKNAIDPAPWVGRDDRDDVRRELGLRESAPVIVTVCRVMPGKGIDHLIQALPAIRDELPDVALVVVGGEVGVPGYRRHLEQVADELGVADLIHFTGRRADVPRIMSSADLFAMPSIGEPFGLVFLEAMASGLPVVAYDSGGTPEVVIHEVTGLLSAPTDIGSLVANLLRLLNDPEARATMGRRGERLVQESFLMSRMSAEVAALYADLAAGAR